MTESMFADHRRRLRIAGAVFVAGAIGLAAIRLFMPHSVPLWVVVVVGFVTALAFLAATQALDGIWFGAPSGTMIEALVRLAFGLVCTLSFILLLVAIKAVAGIPPRYMKPGGPTSLEPPIADTPAPSARADSGPPER